MTLLRRMTLPACLAGVAALLLLAAPAAHANTLTPTIFSIVAEGGDFRWTYDVAESANGRVTNGAAPGPVTPQNSDEGDIADFFTIYDFSGFIPGSNLEPAGWAFQSLNSGSTNNANVGVIVDDPNIPNLTWYWTGAARPGEFTDLGFSALTPFNQQRLGDYSSEDTHHSPGFPISDGETDEASGAIIVPQAVPEPASALLLGMALLGGARAYRRRKA